MLALSHRIHAHPEIGFEEELTWLCEVLTDAGFRVDQGICGCLQRLALAPTMGRCIWSLRRV
jgi:metal-dependent amidase/aminoacylase/carboxypeptidase family protein